MTETPPEAQPDPSTEPPAGSQDAPGTPTGEPGGEPTDELSKVRREAASRRVALREAEQERDQLRTTVAGLQRGQVETLAAARLRDPTDLWQANDVSLDALLDDQGQVDAEKVDAAVTSAIEAKPHWARQVDFGGGVRGPATQAAPSFGEALKRRIGQQPLR